MADKNPQRQKIMLGLVLILALVFFLDSGDSASSSGSTSGILDILNGNDRIKKSKEYRDALNLSELSKLKNHELEVLRSKILARQTEFWSYTNGTSPRSLIQQEINRTLRSAGFSTNAIRVGIGNERSAKAEYLQYADYPLSGTINVKDIEKLADFTNALERKAVKYHWRSFSLTVNRTSSRSNQPAVATMRFNGSVRVYILNNKAAKLLSENKS